MKYMLYMIIIVSFIQLTQTIRMKRLWALIIVCMSIVIFSYLWNMTLLNSERMVSNYKDDGANTIEKTLYRQVRLSLSTEANMPDVVLEVADTVELRKQWLMYRESLCEHCGMLFIFWAEKIQEFWMKNTYLSLDMIFLDTEGCIVDIAENIQPESEEYTPYYRSRAPAQYVIEMNGWWVRDNLFLDAHGHCVDMDLDS